MAAYQILTKKLSPCRPAEEFPLNFQHLSDVWKNETSQLSPISESIPSFVHEKRHEEESKAKNYKISTSTHPFLTWNVQRKVEHFKGINEHCIFHCDDGIL